MAIITYDDVITLTRPISKNIDKGRVDICIEEAENLDVTPTIGDTLMIDIASNPSNYGVLLNGGIYGEGDNQHKIAGLKKAIAYYAAARLVRIATGQLSRFGFVEKDGEYSHAAEQKYRGEMVNDMRLVADQYLTECVMYLSQEQPFKVKDGLIKRYGRTTYKIIGE